MFDCIFCDDDEYHNDPDNYDENGVYIGGK